MYRRNITPSMKAADAAIPLNTFYIDRRPLPPALVQLIKEKRRLYRQYNRTHDPHIKRYWIELNAIIRRRAVLHRENSWITSCASLGPRNGALFRRRFKCLTGQLQNKNHHLLVDRTLVTTEKEKAEAFANLMKEIHQPPQDPRFDDTAFPTTEQQARESILPLASIAPPTEKLATEEDVKNAILSKKGKSAPGEDGITYTILKNIPNYGFRPQRAVQDATLRLTTSITNTINSGHIATAAFLDLERAFDKVWHAGIIVKLVALACPPHLLRAISGFLRNRTARVRVGQLSSPPFTLHAGVPQGSILSPLRFIMYCWDLPCPTDPNVHQQQYADDTVCWATSNDPEDANQKFQLQLAALESWMRRWRIKPNPSKTQLIQFKHRHKRPKTQPTITLWETEVTSTNKAKYLGINFNATLNWCTDIHICLKQVRRRMNLITSLRTRLRGCSERVQTTTYKAFINTRKIFLG
ncbi:hypothetical protein CBL_03003 [Carabus blaptoides fortunei]